MTNETKKMLSINAVKIRMGIIEGTYGAKAGHPGGSLSAADYFAYLYFKEMKNLDAACEAAMTQIKEKRYQGALSGYSDKVLLVGINYNAEGKDKKHHTCVIEEWKG